MGRHSDMLEKAITAAQEKNLVDDLDMGMVSVARAAAFALDEAEKQAKPGYVIAQLLTPYREALAELKLTPTARNAAAPAAAGTGGLFDGLALPQYT